MKAAYQNFLGSLAIGENVGKSMTALMSTVSTFFFGNFLPMLGTIARSIPAAIGAFLQEGLPILINNIATMLKNITAFVSKTADGLSSKTVSQWVTKNVPRIIKAGAQLIGKLALAFINNMPKIVAAIGRIGVSIVTGLGSALWGKVSAAAAGIRDRFLQPINTMKSKVQGVINKIKGFFPIKVGKLLSGLKLPHFSISGSFSLNPPSIPKVSVSWYAQGGIVTQPAIFGNIGMGDVREAIVPLDPFWKKMDEMANNIQGGNTVNIYINGSDKDPKAIAEEVKRVLIKETNQRRLAWQ